MFALAWICPTCSRSFKIRNQPHSCLVRDVHHHFGNKIPEIKAIFDRITAVLDPLGPVHISYVENAILIAASSTFLAIKPKKDHVAIEFLLDHEVTEFPIYKTVRVSKNKVAHFIKLDSTEDIDKPVTGWLTEAYRSNTKVRKDPKGNKK
jgi:hypothetical protein